MCLASRLGHICLLFLTLCSTALADGDVFHVRLEGPIGPMTAEFVDGTLSRAESEAAACLIVEMDTPGGLDLAMRRIVKRVLAAEVPVVVYVSPSGSRAASAGVFITLAAHVAAMAPGTNIGAAHPVQLGGAIPDTTVAAKATNDAAAYIRSLAGKRGRNATWAERSVRDSESITEREALEQNVIDLVAPTVEALLDSLHGREVEVLSGSMSISTESADIIEIRMGLRDRLLAKLSDPNIAYILMILGIYGLMFELYNPGAILPGIVGGICILLAFFAFQTLPVNYAGLLLILLSIVFFVLEVKVTSYGALTIGGIVAMLLGSAMLFDAPGNLVRVSWTVIAPAVLVTVLFFGFAITMGLRAQKRAPLGGPEELIGQSASARTDINDDGTVFVAGEYWQAVCDGHIPKDSSVVVVEVRGKKLKVKHA